MEKDFSYGIIPVRHLNNQWQVLLVQHQAGHWAFPKGHPEENESAKETAERELFEETGLKVKQHLNNQLFEEVYFFKKQNKLIHKQVSYFLAIVEGRVEIQQDEIKAFQWLFLDASLSILSFNQSKEIIKIIKQILNGF